MDYRRLVLDAPVAIAVHVDGVVRFANPAAVAFFAARDIGDLVGRGVEEFLPSPDLRTPYEERTARVLAGEVVRDERQQFRRLDGVLRWSASDSVAIDWDGDRAIQVVLRDVSEMVEAEQREQRLAEQLDAIFEHSPALIFLKDLDGRYLRVNRPWLEAAGLDEDAVIGKTETELFPEVYDEVRHERAQRTARETVRAEEAYGDRWFDTIRFPLRDAAGRAYAVCAMSIEVTAAKQAQRALERRAAEFERSNRDLQRFAYVASHDLAEPLRTINSFALLLSRRYAGQLDAQADEFLGFITSGVERMRGLLDGLLTYSRAGQDEEAAEPVALGAVMDEIVSALETAIAEAGARIAVGELPVVEGNRVQLRQILQNLIGNALKFAHPERSPRIAVAAERQERGWRITVSDNGIGVDPEQADRIFEIFQRLHARDEYEGTGLGLALVRRLVEARGGSISATAAPDGGSVFAFTLPDLA
jgi:PAS domain S-box-containing protein